MDSGADVLRAQALLLKVFMMIGGRSCTEYIRALTASIMLWGHYESTQHPCWELFRHNASAFNEESGEISLSALARDISRGGVRSDCKTLTRLSSWCRPGLRSRLTSAWPCWRWLRVGRPQTAASRWIAMRCRPARLSSSRLSSMCSRGAGGTQTMNVAHWARALARLVRPEVNTLSLQADGAPLALDPAAAKSIV